MLTTEKDKDPGESCEHLYVSSTSDNEDRNQNCRKLTVILCSMF